MRISEHDDQITRQGDRKNFEHEELLCRKPVRFIADHDQTQHHVNDALLQSDLPLRRVETFAEGCRIGGPVRNVVASVFALLVVYEAANAVCYCVPKVAKNSHEDAMIFSLHDAANSNSYIIPEIATLADERNYLEEIRIAVN